VRERPAFGGDCFLLGFTTHTGTVAAASDWGEAVELKRVLPSRDDSWEHLLHRCGIRMFLLPLRGGRPASEAQPRARLRPA
jgi:erythromycin esterase-like protein